MRSFHNPGKVSGRNGWYIGVRGAVRGEFKHFWSSLVANLQIFPRGKISHNPYKNEVV